MNDYILKEEIGKGNMSIVYKGRKKRTINFYAIYSIEKAKRPRVLENVGTLRTMSHENVIQFHNWYETANHLWVITELCVGGDLGTILHHDPKMKPSSVRLLGADIVSGLFYIHSKGFVYRDLKPGNLLMDSRAMLRFYDFGLACVFGAAADTTTVGTPLYMAPELFVVGGGGGRGTANKGPVGGVPSMASDLWSLGCILYQMAAGAHPFAGKDLETVLRNILTKQPARISDASDAFNTMVLGLLAKDPLQRTTWSEVIGCSFWDDRLEDLRAKRIVASEPAFDAYRREIENGRGTAPSSASPWSAEDVNAAIAAAIAAAKANLANSPAFSEEEESFGEVNPGKEVDFATLAASPAHSSSVGDSTPARRSVVASATSTQVRSNSALLTPPSSFRSRAGSGAEPVSSSRRNNNYVSSGTGGRRGSGALRRGSANRPLTYLTTTDRLTKRQLEDIAGGLLPATNICGQVWHKSDNNIRPLCANARIERYTEPTYDPAKLTFLARKPAELKEFEDIGSFIRSIYKPLSSDASSPDTKENILRYIETLVSDSKIANLLVNSSIMTLCIDQMEAKSMPVSFRAAAASVAGKLVRYAITIFYEVARSYVIPRLLRLFEDESNVLIKRKVFVCIGELIFYVYAQKEDYDRAPWGIVPADVQRVFIKALETNDDLIRHYAAKTIENLSTTYDQAENLCTVRVVGALLAVYALPPLPTRNTHMRSSALCAALQLAAWREELILTILKSDALPHSSYGDTLAASSLPRTAQVLLAFLITALVKAMAASRNPFTAAWASLPGASPPSDRSAMLNSTLSVKDAETIMNDILDMSEELTERLCDASDRISMPLRAKTLLFYVALGCLGGSVLSAVCTSRNVALLDRIMRDEDDYVKACSPALCSYLSVYISEKLGSVSRACAAATAPLYLSSTQQILSLGTLRGRIEILPSAFKSLGEAVHKALTNTLYSTYEEEFNNLCDRLTQSPDAVVQHYNSLCAYLVEPYAVMLQRKEGARRFAALRFLVSVMAPLAADSRVPRDRAGSATGSVGRAAGTILDTANRSLASLLADSSPIPTYTLRLLATCGECSPSALNSILSASLISSIMDYVSPANSDGDLFYPLKLLCTALVNSTGEEYIAIAVKRKLLPTLLQALRSAMSSGVDHVLEVGCDLAAFLLSRSNTAAASRTAVTCSEELLEDDGLGTVFLPLATAGAGNPAVNEKAAQVVHYLVQLSPAAQSVMVSSRGVNTLCAVLQQHPLNAVAAEWMLKTMRMAAEALRGNELQQKLGGQDRLIAALDAVAGRGTPRAVSTEATRLSRLIKG